MRINRWWISGSFSIALVAVLGAWATTDGGERWIKRSMSHPFDSKDEIDADAAEILYGWRGRDGFRFDPVAYLIPEPHTEVVCAWDEHSEGRLILRSNDLGFREDAPISNEKHGLRVLVAGDSHTQGLVYNHESFANRLEAHLRATDAECEVINAGVAYTGPYAYAGILRKYLYLEPDVFVATLFTGNDFWNDLHVRYTLSGWTDTDPTPDYFARLERAKDLCEAPLSQGMNQAFRFKHYPAEAAVALDAVIESYERMQALCDDNGIRFVALVLPTKMDVDGEDDADVRTGIRAALDLSPDDVALNRRLADAFVQAMRERGIVCVDPTDEMERSETVLYWRKDYHLAPAGHQFLATHLFDELRGDV